MVFVGELIFDPMSDIKSIWAHGRSMSQVWAVSVCRQRCMNSERKKTPRTICRLLIALSSNLLSKNGIICAACMYTLCVSRDFVVTSFVLEFSYKSAVDRLRDRTTILLSLSDLKSISAAKGEDENMTLTLALRRLWSLRDADSMCSMVMSMVGVWLLVGSVFIAFEIANTESSSIRN
jgi:hypothetical protein